MSDTAWRISIRERYLPGKDKTIYSCEVQIVPTPQTCKQGTCGHHAPAYDREDAVTTIREMLDDIRDGQWNQPDKPAPRPENTELDDETGEFGMDDFFETGTLAAYVAEGGA